MASNQNFYSANPISSVTLTQNGQNNIYTTSVGSLYSDQAETVVLTFAPASGGTIGDAFTATIKLRKTGTQAYIEVVSVTTPSLPTAPTWNSYVSNLPIPASYRPDLTHYNMAVTVNDATVRRSCVLVIGTDGILSIVKTDTGSFAQGTRLLTLSQYYTLAI